jgi:hypothetical protein
MEGPTQEWNRPYAEQWLERLRGMERCAWCGEDENKKPLNRDKLCSACLRTKRYAARLRKRAKAILPLATEHERRERTHELRIAGKMADICQWEGEQMETILNSDAFDVVDLEQSLNRVASAVCHRRDFFHGKANELASTFTPAQRRILAYLLWKPILADRKRRHKQMAMRFLLLEDPRRSEQESASDS